MEIEIKVIKSSRKLNFGGSPNLDQLKVEFIEMLASEVIKTPKEQDISYTLAEELYYGGQWGDYEVDLFLGSLGMGKSLSCIILNPQLSPKLKGCFEFTAKTRLSDDKYKYQRWRYPYINTTPVSSN